MEEREGTSFLDFREVLWKARRYKWMVLFPIVLLFCGACVFLIATPPVYESAVVVTVDDHSTVSKDMNALVGRSDRYDDNIRQRVQRVDGRIHSRSFLEAVVNRTGLAKNRKLRQQAEADVKNMPGVSVDEYAMRLAVTTMGKQIVVTPQGDTEIRIAAKGRDPRSARSLATLVGDELVVQNKATSIQKANERGAFSADQIAVYEERLKKSEDAYQSYQQSVIGRKLTGNPVNETNFDAAKQVIAETRAEQGQIRSRLETDLSAWQSSGGSGAGPPALGNSRTAELESRLSELETSYGLSTGQGADPENLKLKIGGIRQALYAEYQNLAAKNPNLSDASREAAAGIALDRAELRSLKQKEMRLSRYTASFSSRLESQPTEQITSDRLRMEVENNRELLQSLQKEATASHLSAALETSPMGMDFEILENPQLPLRPTFPDPLRILGIALFMGPLLGVGLAILAERYGATLSTLEQAEREIGARVVGTIPRIEGWSQPGGYMQKYWPVLSIALVLIATALFYTIHATVVKPDTSGIVQTQP